MTPKSYMYSVVTFQGFTDLPTVENGCNTDKPEIAFMSAHKDSINNKDCYIGLRFNLDGTILAIFYNGDRIYDYMKD